MQSAVLARLSVRLSVCLSHAGIQINEDRIMRSSLRAFQRSIDKVRTLPPSPRKGGSKSKLVIFICPIAIAYSMGQIIKSVCVCQSVCVWVCPCVVTLTVAFFCRFLPNLTQRCKPPKVRTSSLGVDIAPPLPLFYS